MNKPRFILTGAIFAAVQLHAQQPTLFYDFSLDGVNVNNLGSEGTDGVLTGGAVIGAGGPATGFSGGPTGSILVLDGNENSYVNSNISAGFLGFTSDNYTAASWIRLDSYGGDSMIFGQRENTGSDTYLHNGVRDNSAHIGHWGNDTTGPGNLNTTIGVGTWFHLSFRYRGDEQSIYVNGNLVARELRGNLPSTSNVLIGSSNNNGGIPGALDDVVVYNSSLRADQIAFLAAGGNPNNVAAAPVNNNLGLLGAPGSISPTTQPAGPGSPGAPGQWGVREIASSDGNQPDNLVQALNILKNAPAGSTVADGFTSVVNRLDPGFGASHLFTGDTPFLTDTAGADDNRRAFLYRAKINVPTEGDYTFGYHGDDGFALRIGDTPWTSHSGGDRNLGVIDFDDARTLAFPVGTGDANLRGTIHLTAGQHDIELISWEGVGGGSHELYYAPGTFVNDADTLTWRLVGGAAPADNTLNLPSVNGGWNVTTSLPVNPGNGTMTNIAAARAALAATGTTANGIASINFNDPQSGGPGSIPGDVPFHRDTGLDDEDFAVLAGGILRIEVGDTYRFGFQGDDGGYLRIAGVGEDPGTADNWTIVENATGLAYIADMNGLASPEGDTLWADVLTGNSRTVADVFLAPGDYSIESLFFERGGGAFFEVFVGDPDSGTPLQLLTSTSHNVDLSSSNIQVVPEPTSVAMLLGGFGALLGFQRLRRRH